MSREAEIRKIRVRWQSVVIPEWSKPIGAEAQKDICELLARLAELEAALREIAEHPIVSEDSPDQNCDWHCTRVMTDIARAALASPSEETIR